MKKRSPLRGILIGILIALAWPYTRGAILDNIGVALAGLVGLVIAGAAYGMLGTRRR